MVEITTNTKSAILAGTEAHVHFTAGYPYFWIRNDSGDKVLMSLSPNIEEGVDGVIEVLAGSSAGTMHGYNATRSDLYLLGGGKVQIMGTYTPENPFKTAGKGGDNRPTQTDFDMTGITARFDVSGIDVINKIWINSVEDGNNLTFTDGSIVNNSLMIPGNEYGEVQIPNAPFVLNLVFKKEQPEDDLAVFFQDGPSGHGYTIAIYRQPSLNPSFIISIWQSPYINVNIDPEKWHLFTFIELTKGANELLLFVDGAFMGGLGSFNNNAYGGKMWLNCVRNTTSGIKTSFCQNPSYFKHMSTGILPQGDLNIIESNRIINNMNWLMKNIVDPANKEV